MYEESKNYFSINVLINTPVPAYKYAYVIAVAILNYNYCIKPMHIIII